MHQLLLNFDQQTTQSPNAIPDEWSALVRDVIKTIIEKHSENWWPHGQTMRGPVDLLAGSETRTLEAQTRKIATRIHMDDIEAARVDHQAIVDHIATSIAAEFNAELAHSSDMNFYPYHLVIPSAGLIEDDNGSSVLCLMTRYAMLPK